VVLEVGAQVMVQMELQTPEVVEVVQLPPDQVLALTLEQADQVS
jgi:hypothetical protein